MERLKEYLKEYPQDYIYDIEFLIKQLEITDNKEKILACYEIQKHNLKLICASQARVSMLDMKKRNTQKLNSCPEPTSSAGISSLKPQSMAEKSIADRMERLCLTQLLSDEIVLDDSINQLLDSYANNIGFSIDRLKVLVSMDEVECLKMIDAGSFDDIIAIYNKLLYIKAFLCNFKPKMGGVR
jgi:hypothetical protein